ncbi:thioesterase-like superfamily domain-containing protein [Ditylenchus destructor]|nr:thioesterase-like superfamily domain-containing protein [Ditylenchus destructor]
MKHSWMKLQQISEDIFKGERAPMKQCCISGGVILTQALAATYKTVPLEFLLNSFHAYFVSDDKGSIIYEVKRLRNGRNFVIRSVEAIQHGQIIYTFEFLFQNEPNASKFKVTPIFPNVTAPETMQSVPEFEHFRNEFCMQDCRNVNPNKVALDIDIRLCEHDVFHKETGVTKSDENVEMLPNKKYFWVRYCDHVDIGDFKSAHFVLTYISNLIATRTVQIPFYSIQPLKNVTLFDQSMWVHEFRFDVNEWLLFEQEYNVYTHTSSIVSSRVWTRSGSLLASTKQEAQFNHCAQLETDSNSTPKSKL